MHRFFVALAALWMLPGQQASQPVTRADTPTVAYHDATGFAYTYPAAFSSNPSVTASLMGQLKGGEDSPAKKCIEIPLAATKGTGAANQEFGLILILRVDQKCMADAELQVDLNVLVQQMTQLLLKRFGNSSTEDPLNYKLDQYTAAFVQGSTPAKMLGEGRMLHAGTVCALAGPNAVCWFLLDTDHKVMPSLMATTVAFAGRPEVPLVPKDMVRPW